MLRAWAGFERSGELPPLEDLSRPECEPLVQALRARVLLGQDAEAIERKPGLREHRYVRLTVREDGAGIAPGLLGRMFGGTVAEVMAGAVAEDQRKFIAFAD